jgi:hypothetical protein
MSRRLLVGVFGALLLVSTSARAESFWQADVLRGCTSHGSCVCGESCVFSICQSGTDAILNAACRNNFECAVSCTGYVCRDARCVLPDAGPSDDLGDSAVATTDIAIDAPLSRPDVVVAQDRAVPPADLGVPARDVSSATPDRVMVDTPDARDTATPPTNAASDAGEPDDTSSGRVVQMGCASTPRTARPTPWSLTVVLAGLVLRRARRRRTTRRASSLAG